MKWMEEDLELLVLTKTGYIRLYGPASLEDIIKFAYNGYGDDFSKIVTKEGKLIYEGKINRLLMNTVGAQANGNSHSYKII